MGRWRNVMLFLLPLCLLLAGCGTADTATPQASPTVAASTPVPAASSSAVTPATATVAAPLTISMVNTMVGDAHPVFLVHASPGAACTASVVYFDNSRPPSFRHYDGVPRTVPASGELRWTWYEQTKTNGGYVRVTCSSAGAAQSAITHFYVIH